MAQPDHRSARPRLARRHAGHLDGRIRPHAADQHRVPPSRAATTIRGPGAWSCSAAASAAARSSAAPTPRPPPSPIGRSRAFDFMATVCRTLGIDYNKMNNTPNGRPDPHRRARRRAGPRGFRWHCLTDASAAMTRSQTADGVRQAVARLIATVLHERRHHRSRPHAHRPGPCREGHVPRRPRRRSVRRPDEGPARAHRHSRRPRSRTSTGAASSRRASRATTSPAWRP